MQKLLMTMLALLLTAGFAQAETVRLSITDVIRAATEKNSLVKAAGYRATAARQGIAIAESRYYPGIAFEETFTASNAPTQTFMMKLDEGRFTQNDFQIANLNNPGTAHDFRTAVTLYQPLFTPSIAPAKEIAVKEAEKQEYRSDGTKADIGFNAFRIYLELQQAKAQTTAAEQSVTEARESLRLAVVRSEAGMGLKSDGLRARTHLAQAEQRLISERIRSSIAGLRLANLLGMKDGDSVDTDAQISPVTIITTADELLTIARENRSDLKESRSELEKSAAELRLARREYLPTVGAFASYQLNDQDIPFGADNNSWSAGVSLKWQLFDGFKRGHEQDRARANQAATAALQDDRQRSISLGIRESYLRREEAAKRLEVARLSLADAEETVRLLGKRFENSLATMAELLDAQTVLQQSRANLIETESGYALAGGQILYAAGIFLKEMVK